MLSLGRTRSTSWRIFMPMLCVVIAFSACTDNSGGAEGQEGGRNHVETVVQRCNGVPTIMAGGKPVPPMAFCSRHYTDADYVRKLYERGIRVFFIFTATEWYRPGEFERLKKKARFNQDNAPEVYFILPVYC